MFVPLPKGSYPGVCRLRLKNLRVRCWMVLEASAGKLVCLTRPLRQTIAEEISSRLRLATDLYNNFVRPQIKTIFQSQICLFGGGGISAARGKN